MVVRMTRYMIHAEGPNPPGIYWMGGAAMRSSPSAAAIGALRPDPNLYEFVFEENRGSYRICWFGGYADLPGDVAMAIKADFTAAAQENTAAADEPAAVVQTAGQWARDAYKRARLVIDNGEIVKDAGGARRGLTGIALLEDYTTPGVLVLTDGMVGGGRAR